MLALREVEASAWCGVWNVQHEGTAVRIMASFKTGRQDNIKQFRMDYGVRVQTGFNWLRTGSSWGLL